MITAVLNLSNQLRKTEHVTRRSPSFAPIFSLQALQYHTHLEVQQINNRIHTIQSHSSPFLNLVFSSAIQMRDYLMGRNDIRNIGVDPCRGRFPCSAKCFQTHTKVDHGPSGCCGGRHPYSKRHSHAERRACIIITEHHRRRKNESKYRNEISNHRQIILRLFDLTQSLSRHVVA